MSEKIIASPNPFTHILQVKINNFENDLNHCIVRLIDEKGDIQRMMGISLVDGINNILVEKLHKLSPGSYLLDVKNMDGESVFSTRLLKKDASLL